MRSQHAGEPRELALVEHALGTALAMRTGAFLVGEGHERRRCLEVLRLEGRDAIAAYMAQLPAMLRFGPVDDVRVRQAGDETIVEAVGHHRRADGDRPVDLRYIWFITRRDGEVTHIRDYMNPDQLARLTSQDASSG